MCKKHIFRVFINTKVFYYIADLEDTQTVAPSAFPGNEVVMSADGQGMEPGVDGKSDASLSRPPSEEGDDVVDVESLKPGALEIAKKVVSQLLGSQESIDLQFLARGGYNHVWLLKYLSEIANDQAQHKSVGAQTLVLRIPKEDAKSLFPYQLRHEVACLRYLAQNLPSIPAPKVYAWDDKPGQAFVAQEFITGQRLSVVWPQLTDEQRSSVCLDIANVVADLGQTRFDFIGSFTADGSAGPTIEAGKIFNGRSKFHSPEYYNIGPYADSKEYILSCYDREIYYYTHADTADIVMEAFEHVSVADFVKALKAEREDLSKEASVFQAIDAEPCVLAHEDFHAGNMLVDNGRLAGVIDWEFSGVYPLSELLGAVPLIQVSSPFRTELTEHEEDEWHRRYHQDLKEVVRQRGWKEENINTLFSDGWQALQRARTVRFPEDDDAAVNDNNGGPTSAENEATEREDSGRQRVSRFN